MRVSMVDELEEFIGRGVLWDPDELAALIDSLELETRTAGDAIPALLAQPLRLVLQCSRSGPVDRRTAGDVEAVVYPRVWKVMEAVRDGLPDGELRTRIDVLARRLVGCLAAGVTH
ncbi:MAG: hypothetical protein M3N98_02385 [Actinomycetota bacterium]|nr:hypothetical protein [Actinomycetota bacterium]